MEDAQRFRRRIPARLIAVALDSLYNGETILWAGRPLIGRLLLSCVPYVTGGVLLASVASFLIWCAWWVLPAPESTVLEILTAVARVMLTLVAGVVLVVGVAWAATPAMALYYGPRTLYLVTSHRAMTIVAAWAPRIHSFGPERVRQLHRTGGIHGPGDICFGTRKGRMSATFASGFPAVPEASTVERILRDLAAGTTVRESPPPKLDGRSQQEPALAELLEGIRSGLSAGTPAEAVEHYRRTTGARPEEAAKFIRKVQRELRRPRLTPEAATTRLGGYAMLAFGFLSLVCGFIEVVPPLWQTARQTQGLVARRVEHEEGGWLGIVAYQVDGKTYETSSIVYYSVGQSVPVLYSVNAPAVACVNSFYDRWLGPVALWLMGLVAVAFGTLVATRPFDF